MKVKFSKGEEQVTHEVGSKSHADAIAIWYNGYEMTIEGEETKPDLTAPLPERISIYMLETGYYDTRAILVQFDGYDYNGAFFVDSANESLNGWDLSQFSEEYQYAYRYNNTRSEIESAADERFQDWLGELTETPDEQLTETQWEVLAENASARKRQVCKNEAGQILARCPQDHEHEYEWIKIGMSPLGNPYPTGDEAREIDFQG